MYSITVRTSDSSADYGTTIPSTEKLKTFLCALEFQQVTHLEISYYRELTGTEIPTAPMPVVESVTDKPTEAIQKEDAKPATWEPDTMGLPL